MTPRPEPVQVLLARHLGDAVLALPALRGLADAGPLRVVAAGAAAAVVEGQGDWTVSPALTRGPAVLFARSLRAAIAAMRAGCSPRVGEAGDGRRALLTHVVSPPPAPLPARVDGHRLPALLVAEHQGDAYVRVARTAAAVLGAGELQPGPPDLRIDPQPSGPVVLHPWAAGAPTKRWPEDRWVALARALRGRVVVTGGPGGDDAALALRVGAAAGVPTRAGGDCLPILAWASLAAAAPAVVAPDTGVGHVARAAGATLVSLFGPTDPRRHAPRGPGRLTLLHGGEALPCSPCYAASCRHDPALACLRSLSLEDVLDAVAAP